jgi:hypothetical protein
MSTLHNFKFQENRIPEIDEQEIRRRASLIFPCIQKENEIILMKNCGDPINQSFSWNFQEDEILGTVSSDSILVKDRPAESGGWYMKRIAEKVGEFITLHGFAYYGFYKPSVGEIVSQLPSELFDEKKLAGRKLYFTNQMISSDINVAMLEQNWHIAKTKVYIQKK